MTESTRTKRVSAAKAVETTGKSESSPQKPSQPLASKRVLVVTASRFNRTELFSILQCLASEHYTWDIVSSRHLIQTERGPLEKFKAKYIFSDLDQIDVADYEGFIFTSGDNTDTRAMWFDTSIRDLVLRADKEDKVIAGICCAAPCVRYAAVGRRVTGFPLHEILSLFKSIGAILTGHSVEVDGNLITAEAEPLVLDWMNVILRRMRGEEVMMTSQNATKHFNFWTGVADTEQTLERQPYSAGIAGSVSLDDLAALAPNVQGTNICAAFGGVGRQVSIMAKDQRHIVSFDTMFFCKTIIDGVFKSKKATDPQLGNTVKGWAYKNQPVGIDDASAAFVDTVAATGDLYALAALGSALVKSTMMGRFDQWNTTPDKFVEVYERHLLKNRAWLNLPGILEHHHMNVFSDEAQEILNGTEWDTLVVNPPKVVGKTDVYSARYESFESCLTQQDVTLPVWTGDDMLGRMDNLFSKRWKRLIFMYTSGTNPAVEELEYLVHQHGRIVRRYRMPRGKLQDVLFIVDRI